MRSILITGCNRGLGLGLVKHLTQLEKSPKHIFATCRDTKKATELTALAEKFPNIHVISIDVTHTKEYDRVVSEVREKVGDEGLNVLFNNAGISPKFTRLNFVKEEQLMECFHVNTVAPILLAKAFLPLLRKASANFEDKTRMTVERSAILHMTSVLGSMTLNDQGGFYPYRCSKAAINAATKAMSIDLKDDGILVACIHPGWVRTDLGGSNAPLDVDSSVNQMLKTLGTLTEKHTGSFVQYDGQILPW